MSDGALRIPITGDASQFKATLSEIESSLKYFRDKLKSAKGDQVAKINFTIAGLEDSKIALTTFGKFAEGTLGALNQQISQLNRQKLNVQADATALAPINQELDKLIKKRDELNKAGLAQPIVDSIRPAAESIAGLRLRIQELNDIKILIDPKINPSALAKINKEIDLLEDKASNLDNLGNRIGSSAGGATNGLKKFEDQSKQSRIAVTNLALVLQDLPFGFIAIQNNLPALQASLSNLKTSSEGVKGALQSFSSALVGPGGFFLAFSAVTAAVTYAIQKYGSLGAALDVLTSRNRIATETQLEFNKALGEASGSIGGDIAKIQILVKTYQDENSTQVERLATYRALKEINPKIVAGIDDQNYATAASIELVGRNAKEIINLIKVQTQQKAISKVLDELTEKRFAANGKFNAAKKKADEFNAKIAAIEMKEMKDRTTAEKNAYAARRILADGYAEDLNNVRAEIKGIATEEDKWYNSLKPITTEISNSNSNFETLIENLRKLREEQKKDLDGKAKNFTPTIDTQDLDEAFNLDKIKSNVEKYGNALIDLNNTEKERKNALKELLEINPEYFKSFDLNKKRIDELRASLESYIRTLLVEKKSREDSAAASKINADLRKSEEKGIKSLGDKYNYLADSKLSIPDNIEDAIELSEAWDKVGNSTDKATKSNNKLVQSLKFGQDVIEILKKGLNLKETYNNALEDLLNFSEYSRKEIEKISKDLRFLQEPLEGLFTTLLEDGKVSWKTFADDVIKQIRRIAAALLSKAIIQGIANILAPGSGAVVSRGLKAIDTAALEDYSNGNDWIDLFTGGNGRANFGGVRGNNAMNMAGQVNMIIRGNDLVGVMNRTNTTINRVG